MKGYRYSSLAIVVAILKPKNTVFRSFLFSFYDGLCTRTCSVVFRHLIIFIYFILMIYLRARTIHSKKYLLILIHKVVIHTCKTLRLLLKRRPLKPRVTKISIGFRKSVTPCIRILGLLL